MFPIMREALSGLVQQAQFALVKSVQDNFDVVESAAAVGYFLGSLQPIDARRLLVKPEGWRKWKWFSLWTTQEIAVGDFVRDSSGLQYRVMAKSDWSQAAYQEYQIIQSPTLGSEAP